MFLDLLKEDLADKGLDLCKHKTEIITTTPNHLEPVTSELGESQLSKTQLSNETQQD